jgi:cytochrome c oxidase cbb3-type subunit 3
MATDLSATARRAPSDADTDMGHEYDGIREYDNRLPNWWLATLLLSTIFAYGYFFYYHVVENGGSSLADNYKADVAEANSRSAGPIDDKILTGLFTQGASDGAAVFKTTCAVCHGDDGQGKIGPNLTDNAWLHGGKPMDIYNTISNGVVQKGMPAWRSQLGDAKVRLLAAYVAGTLKGKNIANPAKPPEPDAKPE